MFKNVTYGTVQDLSWYYYIRKKQFVKFTLHKAYGKYLYIIGDNYCYYIHLQEVL